MEKDELTYAIIGCAMRVHNRLGNGYQEVIYQRCLAIALERLVLNFKGNSSYTFIMKESRFIKFRSDICSF